MRKLPICFAHSNPYVKASLVGVAKDSVQYLTAMKTGTAQKVTIINDTYCTSFIPLGYSPLLQTIHGIMK